jgi:DHA3 family multidrug efflux protein-like MFS transporter
VISGLLVAFDGMRSVVILAHVARLEVDEPEIVTTNEDGSEDRGVDLRGTVRIVRGVPGLLALIVFSCFNNFLGGTFMALMDAYGLSLVSVQAWGLLWGVLSAGVIIGGLMVARTGVGTNPVRTLLLVNVALWTTMVVFPLRSSIVLLAICMMAFMFVMPYAEASEQTILQRVVPFHRQGRVFGFAQSIEQAASPLTAFLIAPITQLLVIPFMTDGWGARVLGPWFGTGADRGIALVFVVAGIVGLLVTGLALLSRPYRRLSAAYTQSSTARPADALEDSDDEGDALGEREVPGVVDGVGGTAHVGAPGV